MWPGINLHLWKNNRIWRSRKLRVCMCILYMPAKDSNSSYNSYITICNMQHTFHSAS